MKSGLAGGRTRARALVLPLVLNLAAGLACDLVLGSVLGWTAPGRETFPAWIGNGLPFLQFMAVGYLVDRAFRVAAESVTASRPRKSVPKLALQLISVLIMLSFLGASVGVVFGESVSTVLAASGIVGLAVGFAVRGLLADIFSGIALHLDASLSTGDWIDVTLRRQSVSGRLVDIQWRTVVIADRSENLVFIPNSEFATAMVQNRSQPTTLSEYAATLTLDGSYDRARVQEVLENALRRGVADGVLAAQPGPYVRVAGVEQGVVSYRLFYCLEVDRVSPSKGQGVALGYAADFLRAAGFSLRPAQEIEVARPRSPGHDRWTEPDARLAVLAGVPLLAVLSQDELERLARDSAALYLRGSDTVMQAGDQGDSMMVLLEGRVEVQVDGRRVADLWPGECVGEMSLLTGAPRSATVVAAGPVCVLEVPKAALTPVLQANPALVERIAVAIEKRVSATNGGSGQTGVARSGKDDASLVSRIRKFFRL